MAKVLTPEEHSTITVLLQTGKTIKEISKFADLDRGEVTSVARTLNIEPKSKVQKRAKSLFASSDGLTYAEVARVLGDEKLTNDGDPIHYLTVTTWVANHGWPWGGSDDGHYSPDRGSLAPSRSKYTLRMSKGVAGEVNRKQAINAAASAAWNELKNDFTRIVAVAVVKGAASAGVTEIAEVKSALMDQYGDEIRSARE